MFESNRSISLTPSSAALAQYRFVEFDGTDGTVIQVGTSGNTSVGISLESSDDSATAAIAVSIIDGAIMEVESGQDSLPVGGLVMANAEGQAITAATTGSVILGQVLIGGDDEDIVTIVAFRGVV